MRRWFGSVREKKSQKEKFGADKGRRTHMRSDKESLVLTKEVAHYESAVKRNGGTNDEVQSWTVRKCLSKTGDRGLYVSFYK